MLLPVADKLATVGLVALQNATEAEPVGAAGVALTVTCTVPEANDCVVLDCAQELSVAYPTQK